MVVRTKTIALGNEVKLDPCRILMMDSDAFVPLGYGPGWYHLWKATVVGFVPEQECEENSVFVMCLDQETGIAIDRDVSELILADTDEGPLALAADVPTYSEFTAGLAGGPRYKVGFFDQDGQVTSTEGYSDLSSVVRRRGEVALGTVMEIFDEVLQLRIPCLVGVTDYSYETFLAMKAFSDPDALRSLRS